MIDNKEKITNVHYRYSCDVHTLMQSIYYAYRAYPSWYIGFWLKINKDIDIVVESQISPFPIYHYIVPLSTFLEGCDGLDREEIEERITGRLYNYLYDIKCYINERRCKNAATIKASLDNEDMACII